MRRVLHLKMVKQCAMLEEFGIFLVLADKVGLFLYIIYMSLLTLFEVTLCVPHRSTGSIVAAKCSHFTDTTEIEWRQGGPLLQCR